MKLARKIIMHNVNNFFQSVSLHFYLYKNGMESKAELRTGLISSIKERMKLHHWTPSTF